MSISVAIIGECMLELTHAQVLFEGRALPMTMNYGGDTINTAIYLSRNHVDVSYVTGLGDDSMSDWLLNEWSNEGIDCSLVARMPDSVPGMYMINVAEDGERSFLYWRKNSPASRLFDDARAAQNIFESLAKFDFVYLSGISLAILPSESRDRLFGLLEQYRQRGGKIIFDGNYRPTLWRNLEETQQAYKRMYGMTDIALPTMEDEQQLFGFESAEKVLQAISDYGVLEIVVKMGEQGCLALHEGSVNHVQAQRVVPVDTTAAGDSFNAGYLAARFKAEPSLQACYRGHELAAKVIQHHGAIIR